MYATLHAALPGIKLVQVIHVGGEESVEEARAVASEVDALLLDSGRQSLPVKELGGTGRAHDWSLSRRIVEASPVPVYLAGGLTPHNVGDAIRQVRPFGVDVCSGVRSGGRLDEARLTAFVAAVRAADLCALLIFFSCHRSPSLEELHQRAIRHVNVHLTGRLWYTDMEHPGVTKYWSRVEVYFLNGSYNRLGLRTRRLSR